MQPAPLLWLVLAFLWLAITGRAEGIIKVMISPPPSLVVAETAAPVNNTGR